MFSSARSIEYPIRQVLAIAASGRKYSLSRSDRPPHYPSWRAEAANRDSCAAAHPPTVSPDMSAFGRPIGDIAQSRDRVRCWGEEQTSLPKRRARGPGCVRPTDSGTGKSTPAGATHSVTAAGNADRCRETERPIAAPVARRRDVASAADCRSRTSAPSEQEPRVLRSR